ncbi:MAG: hypothetical protein FGM54_10690 [Chitinophagaceae bacterium]|nr:hypothetical protein [Chitinophagaceae bacterium]
MRLFLFLLFMVHSGLTVFAGPAVYPHSKDRHTSFLFQQHHDHYQVSVFDYDLNETSEDEDPESIDLPWPVPIYANIYSYMVPARAPGKCLAINPAMAVSVPHFILYHNIRI